MWLGHDVHIVYVDRADAKRFDQALVTPEMVVSNDSLKMRRGVKMI